METKIIVITPVKNEEWILDSFLSTCSIVADHIIIADQNSTDKSREICRKYSKVILIENNSIDFNEADRQVLLIETARKLFPNNKRILLALDADEIISANAIHSIEWQQILKADPATILYFEKPTFINGTETVIRYEGEGFPLGYIDDGVPHIPSAIHSTRVPSPKYASKMFLKEIKLLHYGLARFDALQSKKRYYSCLECIFKRGSSYRRRISYTESLDFSSEGTSREPVHKDWISGWESKGIQLTNFKEEAYHWYDREILLFFEQYGSEKFHSEDIWYFDWEKAAEYFSSNNVPQNIRIHNIKIRRPSNLHLIKVKTFTSIYRFLLLMKKNASTLFRKR